ncbi:MAG: (Fe-S)-binding protein [Pyrodictiaceae archaeon]
MASLADLLSMIAENTRRTGLPLPAPKEAMYSWARELGIPGEGEVYLYTGGLYQLVPYINSLVRQLEGLEGRRVTGRLALKLAKAVSRVLDLSKIARPDPSEVEYSNSVLRAVTKLLRAAGVSYAYLYEDDGYSGILLYDLGLVEEFSRHAQNVYSRLRNRGVRKIITIDPHTTYALRQLYPKYIDGFDIEVTNYLELLAEKLDKGELVFSRRDRGELVIHDPCYYARFEEILDEPRRLLQAAGYKVREPRRTRKLTYCCGGPVEAISPSLSKRIAETRVEELREYSTRIVTLCPICYANLTRVAKGVEIRDIALYLLDALEG